MGSLLMGRESREQFKNRQAENQAVRRKLWGYDEPVDGADDMEKYVMGDNSESVNHYHQAKPSHLGKALLALAIGGPATAGLIMAPSIIEALKPDPAPVVDQGEFTDTDTQFDLSLGKPE